MPPEGIVPPGGEELTLTEKVSPLFLMPRAMNCITVFAGRAVLDGVNRMAMTRRFFTNDVPVSVTPERGMLAVTAASVSDVSAVYIPLDVMVPDVADQLAFTETVSPAAPRPKAWNW